MKSDKLKTSELLQEMINTQIYSWELLLRKKGLKESTVDRKVKNILDFYTHLHQVKTTTNRKVKETEISKIAFEYVRDGYFSEDNIDNEGSYGYRRNIYFNIMEGFNYIHSGYFEKENIIKELTQEEKIILEESSKNKYFKVIVNEGCNYYSIQSKIIEDLGIKVYFDENNKPYTYSHELAEIIGKKNDKVLRDIRELINKIGLTKIGESSKNVDFTMIEDKYINDQNKEQPTYKLYKDLLLMYLLGLTGKEIVEFKIKYITAFNFIEQEFNNQLLENAKLKEEFYNMYNQIRKRNRDLLIGEHNKKFKYKNKAS